MNCLKKLAILSVLLSMVSPLTAHAESLDRSLGKYLLEPMPAWYKEGFSRGHLNISLMLKDGYSRLEAIEIQNQMKDLLDANPDFLAAEEAGLSTALIQNHDTLVLAALQKAVYRVKNEKVFESGFVPQKLQGHEFYAVFDMDETLLEHWYQSGEKGSKYYDFKLSTLDSILRPPLRSPDYVSMTPGWEKALQEIVKIPGCKGVLVFTAKEDQSSLALIDQLKIGGQPFRRFLKGVFTRNHLVRDSKSVKLSKDLRMIDETLEHVVLVDDNPTRIFPEQQKNLREFPKYNADLYLAARESGKDPQAKRFFENLLPLVVQELSESVKYSQNKKISFASAFYPYSMEASAELITLISQGYSVQDARELMRVRPKMFEPEFYVPAGGKPH